MLDKFKRLIKSLRLESLKKSEDFFLKRIDKDKLPLHIAIIMDGNGRWAKKRGLPRIAGHKAGTETVRRIVKIAAELNIRYLTLYAFSIENWRRPKGEVSALMNLIEEMLDAEAKDLHKNNVKFIVIGRLNKLSESLQKSIRDVMAITKNNTGLTLVLAINYGGRTEIVDCVRQIADKVKQKKLEPSKINEDTIIKHLYLPEVPDPDILIRSGGEKRVSNFLLWEIAYSEFWITPVLWPDFKRSDFFQAVFDFQRRKRRFGGLEEW